MTEYEAGEALILCALFILAFLTFRLCVESLAWLLKAAYRRIDDRTRWSSRDLLLN